MLCGEYQHSLDVKGRTNFPSKLRENLGERLFLVRAPGNCCLLVYSYDGWRQLQDKLRQQPGDIQRFLSSSVFEAEPDKQGRILIPPALRDYAELEREITIIGVLDRAEIWSREHWNNKLSSVTMDEDKLSKAMDELGF